MKKILFTLLLSLLFITPGLVNALELKDGTLVNNSNAHLYIEENANRINNYNSAWFPNGFKAIVSNSRENLLEIIIYTSYISYDRGSYYEVYFNGPYLRVYYNITENCFYEYWNSSSCMDISSSTIRLGVVQGNINFRLDNIIYSYEDLYFEDNLIFEKNWNNVIKYFDVKFNIPSDSEIVLKDSENNIIDPESYNTYKLTSGFYTYSVSKSLYNTYAGTINVSDNMVIDVELVPILDLSHQENIFNSYKEYLLYLVPSIFSLDNPFFFTVFGISILFSLFLLLRKLLKGRL